MDIREQIEALRNHGWYATCELEADAIATSMEAMLSVVEAAKNVHSYCVVDPIACTVSKNRMLELQEALAALEAKK